MKARAIAVGLAAGLVSAMGVLTLSQRAAQARALSTPTYGASVEASPEVVRISRLGRKDSSRACKEILVLYRQNGLRTGADYRVAANTLEASKSRDDLLMAHDMAVAALALGDGQARLVVARTEDILFKSVGLGERYGTQRGGGLPLTESHRRLMTTAANSDVGVPVAMMTAA